MVNRWSLLHALNAERAKASKVMVLFPVMLSKSSDTPAGKSRPHDRVKHSQVNDDRLKHSLGSSSLKHLVFSERVIHNRLAVRLR